MNLSSETRNKKGKTNLLDYYEGEEEKVSNLKRELIEEIRTAKNVDLLLQIRNLIYRHSRPSSSSNTSRNYYQGGKETSTSQKKKSVKQDWKWNVPNIESVQETQTEYQRALMKELDRRRKKQQQ